MRNVTVTAAKKAIMFFVATAVIYFFPLVTNTNCIIHAFSSKSIHFISKSIPQYGEGLGNDLQRCVVPFQLDASSSNNWNDNDNDDDNDNANPLSLDWNLVSLLSCDRTTDAKCIPLIDVYDAAVHASSVESFDTEIDFDDDENTGYLVPTESPSTNNVVGIDDDSGMQDDEKKEEYRVPSELPSTNYNDIDSFSPSKTYDGPLPPSVLPYRMFVNDYNRDMDHDGRFSVFDADSSVSDENHVDMGSPSLQSDVVFCMDNPLEYIRDNLSYSGTRSIKGEETVVFIPGLHTSHGIKTNQRKDYNKRECQYQRSSSDRVKYYSQVLDGVPMALLHKGTHIDRNLNRNNLDIILTSDTINSLISFNLLTIDCINSLSRDAGAIKAKRVYQLRTRDLDIIHTVLSRAGSTPYCQDLQSDAKGLKHTLIRLIDVAVESVREEYGVPSSSSSSKSGTSPHLVLMTYSATSNVLMAALSEWKNRVTTSVNPDTKSNEYREGSDVDENHSNQNFEKKVVSEEEAEYLLRKALTVVTLSCLSKGFIDGPAYIHVSMNDDNLVSSLGVSKLNPEGGGKDAVYLHALSPYLIDDPEPTSNFLYKNDAHNIDSCVIQYLSLVRRINGASSFREMYNLGTADADSTKLDINPSLFAVNSIFSVHSGNVGQLDIPPRIDYELIPAMIRATGGERYLFNPTLQLGDGGVEGFYSPLPSLEYAQAELENQLGYNVYNEIFDNCCQ